MNAIDRRCVLRDFLGGALVVTAGVATAGLAFSPDEAEAIPLAMEKGLAGKADDLVEKAQVVIGPRRGRGRGRRRWVCRWRRGRRVCGWVWV